jgi:hypothetical protein
VFRQAWENRVSDFAYRSVKFFGKAKRVEVQVTQDNPHAREVIFPYQSDWSQLDSPKEHRPWDENPPGTLTKEFPRRASFIRVF